MICTPADHIPPSPTGAPHSIQRTATGAATRSGAWTRPTMLALPSMEQGTEAPASFAQPATESLPRSWPLRAMRCDTPRAAASARARTRSNTAKRRTEAHCSSVPLDPARRAELLALHAAGCTLRNGTRVTALEPAAKIRRRKRVSAGAWTSAPQGRALLA